MRRTWLFLIFLHTGLAAQIPFQEVPALSAIPEPELRQSEARSQLAVFRLDFRQWMERIDRSSPGDTLLLDFDSLRLPLVLEPARRILPETRLILHTEKGEVPLPVRTRSAWSGRILGPHGGPLRFTLTPEHLSGGFIIHGETWIIEPLWYREPEADRDLVVLYRDSMGPLPHAACLAVPAPLEPDTPAQQLPGPGRAIACKLVDYSAATDWAFFQKYGSASEVINRLETVMGLVEIQYTGIFDHDFQFPFLEIFISACPTCDPPEWTSSTDAGVLLGQFRDWGQAGGFSPGHFDVSSLWTGRTLDANVLGAAYIQGVCNGAFRYQVLSDFSTDNSLMRAMVSHEFGHSLSAVHDAGDGYIMSTPLNNTTQWSAASIQAIDQFTPTRFCLSNCYNDPPPVAQFEGLPRSGCAPLTVAYTDQSLNDPTTWSWSFPGATPQSASLQHPQVTYPARGSFAATLTASNPFGSHTLSEPLYIGVEDVPLTGFDLVSDGRETWFTNSSEYAEAYFWDFGDGQQSQEAHPVHTYTADGTYLVTLVAQNACGQSASQRFLTITTPPQAGFLADTLEGCAPLPVRFTDTSSANAEQRLWLFPGGMPDSSSLAQPEVVYLQPGVYPVTLIVRNGAGSDTLHRPDHIRVVARPDTTFQFSMNGDTVFVAWPGPADSLRWDFGDGTFSPDSAVTHQYVQEGFYLLSLHLWTSCGETRIERLVSTLRPPVAQWTVHPDAGCRPFEAHFQDASQGVQTEIRWFFPGGTPPTSEDPEVTVVYDQAGWYPAGLAVRNTAGADTLWRDSVVRAADTLFADFTHSMEGLTLYVESQTAGADTHVWHFGDGDSATTALATHTYAQPGMYTVTYRASNACHADSMARDLQLDPTRTITPSGPGGPRLWPNPAGEEVMVAPVEGDIHFLWLDLAGRMLARGSTQADGLLRLTVPPVPPGWYVLQIGTVSGLHVFRVFRD